MSIKQDQASAKMAEECQKKEYLIPFEEYLTSILTSRVAAKILAPGKSLQGSFDKMQKIARGRTKNGCAYIPPEEGFEIIREYFGITEEDLDTKEPSGVIDIMSFL